MRFRLVAGARCFMTKMLVVDTDHAGRRIDRYLHAMVPDAGFGLIQKLIRKGAVRLDGRKVKADHRIDVGQEIMLPHSLAERLTATSHQPVDQSALSPMEARWLEQMRQSVVADANDVLVFNKPAGLAVQGGSKTKVHVDGLLEHFTDDDGRKPKLVHRLDRDTSGVLLTARGGKAAAMTSQFALRETEKVYLAWCWGQPKELSGVVNAPLLKRGGQGAGSNQELVVVDTNDGAFAESHYRVLATGRVSNGVGPRISLIQWQPRTGRTHQLRVHAAHLGNSIVGDPKYGHKPKLDLNDPDQTALAAAGLQLHAARLKIGIDAVAKTFKAEAPDSMRTLASLIDADPKEIFDT